MDRDQQYAAIEAALEKLLQRVEDMEHTLSSFSRKLAVLTRTARSLTARMDQLDREGEGWL